MMPREVRPDLPQGVLVVIPGNNPAVLLVAGEGVELVVAVVELLVVRGVGAVLVGVEAVLVVGGDLVLGVVCAVVVLGCCGGLATFAKMDST